MFLLSVIKDVYQYMVFEKKKKKKKKKGALAIIVLYTVMH